MNTAFPKEKNVRSATADVLKATAILAVVCIHGSGMIPFSPSHLDFSASSINLAIKGLRFCVPVFIFLWAYFMEKSVIKRGNQSVLPRFRQLLIPFIFWSMVYFLLTADFKTLTLTGIISKHWSGYGWSGQYYFIILFQLILLFPVFQLLSIKIKNHVTLIYILSILFFSIVSYSGWFTINTVDKLNDRPFIYWTPYVVLGIVYANRNIFRLSFPLVIGMVSIVLIPAEIFYLQPKSDSIYLLPSVFICSFVLLSAMESKLTYASMPQWIAVAVQKLAASTLGIFCLNPLVIITLGPLLMSSNFLPQFPGSSIIIPLFSTVVIVSICLLIISLLKRVKLGFLVAN